MCRPRWRGKPTNYEPETMQGVSLDGLWPVCRECHQKVEDRDHKLRMRDREFATAYGKYQHERRFR